MDGPRDYHAKWSKSERDRQISYDTIYMWNLKSDTNELIYKTVTDFINTYRHQRWNIGGGINCLGLKYIHYYIQYR